MEYKAEDFKIISIGVSMKAKQILFLMLFAALGTIGYVLSFGDTSESVDTEGLKKEFEQTCKKYESIEKERKIQIEYLRKQGYKDDAVPGLFLFDEKDNKKFEYNLFMDIEKDICYLAYKKRALHTIILFVETDKTRNSDVNKMFSGLQAGLPSPFPHINLDYDYQRAIRSIVKNQLGDLIIKAWSNTTVKRTEAAMPEYQ